MKNFINPDELQKLDDPIIIDVRTDNESMTGIEQYNKGHLRNAHYLNLETDLSGEVTDETGNHPFPKKEDFKKTMESIGATKDSIFVVYDAGDNFTAGRMWFLLKYFGLDNAYILNGGYNNAVINGYEVTKDIKEVNKSFIELEEKEFMLASYEEVLEQSKKKSEDKVLIDSRAKERYLGKVEPLYDKKGHIPSAKNYFYGDNYDDFGKVKSTEELTKRFEKLDKDKDIIVACGSGVTACANIVAMQEVGLNPRLYIGSYSQWVKKGNDVESKDEN